MNNQLTFFVASGLSILLPLTQGELVLAQSLPVIEGLAEDLEPETFSVQEEGISSESFLNITSQALPTDDPIATDGVVEASSISNGDERPYAYTLGPGDQIQIDIFNVPEFSGANGTHFIPLDGSVQFPWIGKVLLNGLTLAEATDALTARYTPFINNPCDIQPCEFLTMQLLQPRPMRVNVTGEVNRPGVYVVGEPAGGFDSQTQTVTSAIQLAGGITQLANVREIEVYRPQQVGDDVIFPVDFWTLLQEGALEQDLVLRDGDRIVVPTAPAIDNAELAELATANISPATIQVNVVGEVDTPGIVEMPPNASMNQAILAAGGLAKPRAKSSEVDFIRLNPDGSVVNRSVSLELEDPLNEETNPALRNNDIIVVGRNTRTRISDYLGSVTAPLNPILSIGALFRLFNSN